MAKVPSQISTRTIRHYSDRAVDFWEGTRDHDVSQNVEALLSALQGDGPFELLDFGCGPGRDVKTLADLGCIVTGLDGSEVFCEMARLHSGCTVLHQDFLELDLPVAAYDGIFANASLFHVPTSHLEEVLSRLYVSLKPNGILFSSNPRGENAEGWNGERYGAYHDLEAWSKWMERVGFTYVHHYYRPLGRPRPEQPWLASLWRKA